MRATPEQLADILREWRRCFSRADSRGMGLQSLFLKTGKQSRGSLTHAEAENYIGYLRGLPEHREKTPEEREALLNKALERW